MAQLNQYFQNQQRNKKGIVDSALQMDFGLKLLRENSRAGVIWIRTTIPTAIPKARLRITVI